MRHIYPLLGFFLTASTLVAQTYPGSYPETNISNGLIQAKIYTPDPEKGFYRGMRFDWAGVIGSLEYNGHTYFQPFFEKFDPSVRDVVIGDPVQAGVASAASGPVEEFITADESAIGYSDAKPGESFCKIGVGSLRKIDDAPYSSYINYPILDGGKRSVTSGPDWIQFTQELTCGSGYGYVYTKTLRLQKDKPVMTIEHRLVNKGQKPIETRVYDHNFLTIDHANSGPSVTIRFAFHPAPKKPITSLAEIRGNILAFPKDLKGRDTFDREFTGFGKTSADYEIKVENQKTGADVLISGDHPLANLEVWAVRTVVAPEPHIDIDVPVGQEFTWNYTYVFHVGPAQK